MLKEIEEIITNQMKAANAYCCESLTKILNKIKALDWSTPEQKEAINEFDENYLYCIRFITKKNIRSDMKEGFMYVLGNKISNHKATTSKESYQNYVEYFNKKYPGYENIFEEAFQYFIKQHPNLMD